MNGCHSYSAGMKTIFPQRILVPLFFSLLAFLPGKAQIFTANNDSALTAIPATVDRAKMLQLVNDVRKRGCRCGDTYYPSAPPLTWNTLLEKAAYDHTTDMARHKFFSHKAPDDSRAGTRLDRVGYTWKTYGENIGEGYKTEKLMLDGWLGSPGHCKNIMNKSYTEMGVARVGQLWTQEFGSR